ncbi:hypothetical protein JVU11DRAFT_3064 [Chiua virens]|nr:hypothetical protein JVU11DRAFT_3064 [Chiua virens]
MVTYPLAKRLKKGTQLRQPPIYRVLYRDAFLFFFAILATGMLTVVTQTVFINDPRSQIFMGILPFVIVCGQRVILNLRRLRLQSRSEIIIHRTTERRFDSMPPDGRWDTRDIQTASHCIEFRHEESPSGIELSDIKRV